MTKQRERIYQTIINSPRHMTAEEIFDAVRASMPGIARATVYRNLGLMERAGDIRRVRIAGEIDRFDKTLDKHEHVLCPRCGVLWDISLPWLAPKISQALGREAQRISLSIEALCDACAGVEESSRQTKDSGSAAEEEREKAR